MSASTPAAVKLTPRFLSCHGRRLFTLAFEPANLPASQCLLYLPPFAEEMNRCRSHVAAAARALAAHGVVSLLLDPWGTGESEGEIATPTLEDWLDDAEAGWSWLRDHTGLQPGLWGMRSGALLAGLLCERLARQEAEPPGCLLWWQPVLDGQLFLNQYLRLRIASQMVHDGERETTDSIRAQLKRGELVEVAGYPLSGPMADSLAAAKMASAGVLARQPLKWLELAGKAGQEPGVPSRKLAETVRGAGGSVRLETVVCPPIWQTFDREDAPALVPATLELLGLCQQAASP